MKGTIGTFLLALTAAATLTTASFAGEANNGPAGGVFPLKGSGGFTTKAALAVFLSPITPSVDRAVGVKSATNPGTGIFCFLPFKKMDVTKIYPQVTVEWGWSHGNSLLAFYRDVSTHPWNCPAGQIEIDTFDFNAGGTPVPSQNVAFVLVVE
jgi:hypothetical protein